MTKRKIYDPFQISNNIGETWYEELKRFNEKLYSAIVNENVIETNRLLWCLSDLHQLIRVKNKSHKIPLPNHNDKMMRLRGELSDTISYLCAELVGFNSKNSHRYNNNIDWLLKIISEQAVFYIDSNTATDTKAKTIKFNSALRQYNIVFDLPEHTRYFLEDCLSTAEKASTKAIFKELWNKFLSQKQEIVKVIQKEYLPIVEKEDGLYGYISERKRHESLKKLLFNYESLKENSGIFLRNG